MSDAGINPNAGMGRVRITIEFLDQSWDPTVLEMEGCQVTQEAGIHKVYRMDRTTPDMSHNGQQRLLIKAWKGCRAYDTFQANTEATYLFTPDMGEI